MKCSHLSSFTRSLRGHSRLILSNGFMIVLWSWRAQSMWTRSWMTSTKGTSCSVKSSIILVLIKASHDRIAIMPPFPGLHCFPQGQCFKQWTGDNSKALMKVCTLAFLCSTVLTEYPDISCCHCWILAWGCHGLLLCCLVCWHWQRLTQRGPSTYGVLSSLLGGFLHDWCAWALFPSLSTLHTSLPTSCHGVWGTGWSLFNNHWVTTYHSSQEALALFKLL